MEAFHQYLTAQSEVALKQVTVTLVGLPPALSGLTIGFLSDFHVERSRDAKRAQSAVDLILQLQPDLIALGGDYVTRTTRGLDACARILRRLQAPLGVYGILGNHDYWADRRAVVQMLEHAGVTVLVNSNRMLIYNGARFVIAGLDDAWGGKPDIETTFAGGPNGVPAILLAHEPDMALKPAVQQACILQLSGHSHGKQLRLPFLGTRFATWGSRKYHRGLEYAGSLPLYTTSGIGNNISPLLRFSSFPEAVVLRLMPKTSSIYDAQTDW